MKWIGAHIIDRDVRFNAYANLHLPDVADPGSDTDKFLVSGAQGLLGYRTGAEVLSDIGGLPTSTNILAFDGSTANGICTFKDADEISVEPTLTFDASSNPTLTIGADDNFSSFIQKLAHSDGAGGILQVTAGSATTGQTNQAGGGLRLAGGQSTGSGAGGSITLFTSPAGGSGTSINSYSNSWVFGADGSFTTEGGITTGSTSFVNSSGVVQVAAQTNITSLGTLTALDIDDISLNGKTLTIAGDTDDTFSIVTGAAGATTLTTVDTASNLGHFEIAADGHITLDAAGDIMLEAAGNDITMDADTLTIESSSLLSPYVTLKSTGSNAYASYMSFLKQRADDSPADNDTIGSVVFVGEDAGGVAEVYGSIVGSIVEADHGDEAGKIQILVANDGTERNGIAMSGDKGTAAEVDVTIANGAASVTTIAGTLTMGSTAALTNAGLVAVANQSNITGVGTISSGVWEGTTIKTAYIGDDQVTEDKLANTLLAEIDANTAKVTNSDQSKADINALDITEVGTIDSGVWQGTAIASAYLDADTVHLSVDQEITSKTQINKRQFSAVGASTGDCEGDIIYFGSNAASHVAGNIYTLNSSNQWVVTDADATATSIGLLAVAMGTAATDGMCLRGMANLNTTFAGSPANGAILYLDNATAGAATGTAPTGNGDIVRVLGYKIGSGTRMWFNPDNTFVEVTA